jgi:hypothetical protein
MNARARTGKIARLPQTIRDQLNCRLQDGEQGKSLVAWLNSLPEVRAVLKADFGGRSITESNLSEWRQGGYREWQVQQEAIEAVRHMDVDSSELNKASKTPVIDLLSHRLAARYVVATQTLNRPDGEGEIDVKLLHGFCRDVVALRRSDHTAERLEIERGRLKLERDQHHKMQDEEFLQRAWARHKEVLTYIGKRFDERESLYRSLMADDAKCQETSGQAELPEEPSAPAASDESDPIEPNPT